MGFFATQDLAFGDGFLGGQEGRWEEAKAGEIAATFFLR
jgi:hypothetical protein